MKSSFVCSVCNSQFFRFKSQVKNPISVTCSLECKNIHCSKLFTGTKNPNFNKIWSDDQCRKQSILVENKMKDEEVRKRCGSANFGKKFEQERIDLMHGFRDSLSYSHPHTVESKLKIGKKSKEKFTLEYLQKQRSIRETNGSWIPLAEKSDWIIYCTQSNWIDKMFDLVNLPEDFNRIGVYSSKNSRGYVRDHQFSRKTGFSLKVFPEILRHPVNCKIILHSQNSSKRSKDEFTIECLFDIIQNWNGSWKEHSLVLNLIESYKNGKRWFNENRRD